MIDVTNYTFELWHLWSLLVITFAAVIRGYSGFGFSAINVVGQSFFLSPAVVIPINYLLEISVSLPMLAKIKHNLYFKHCSCIVLGACVGIPIGYGVIQFIPLESARLYVSILAIVFSLLLWKGLKINAQASTKLFLLLGLVAGIINGSSSMGGIAIVLALIAIGWAAQDIRSNMVFILMLIDILAIFVVIFYGKLVGGMIMLYLLVLPLVLIGNGIGSYLFKIMQPKSYKFLALCILMFLSIINIVVIYT